LRILLTVHQFLPEHASGTEILTYSVARELRNRGHHVTIFTGYPAKSNMPDSGRFDSYEHEGVEVFRFHHAYVPMGGQRHVTEIEYKNVLAARRFYKLVSETKPEVVHFFHFGRLSASLVDVVLKFNIPAYYTPTDFWAVCPTSQLLLNGGRVCDGPTKFSGNCVRHVMLSRRGPKIRWTSKIAPDFVVDKFVQLTAEGKLPKYRMDQEVVALSRRKDYIMRRLNALNKVFVPTQLMSDVLLTNGLEREKIVHSAYGIDTSYYGEASSEGEKGVFTIGFVGTLAPHKGCHVLLQSIRNMENKGIRVKVYGRKTDFPSYYQKLLEIAKGDERVEFCGTFPNSEIGKVLSGMDILVVPSLWYENTPLVIYSALAAKCPVVASDYPGMSEVVIDNHNGLIFAPGNHAELVSAIGRLYDDRKLLASLKSNCKRPKSVIEYVGELLEAYQADALLLDSGHQPDWMESYESVFVAESSVVKGWAVVEHDAPKIIRAATGGKIVSVVDSYNSRLDVVDGYRVQGSKIKSSLLGFSIEIEAGIKREEVSLELVSMSGKVFSVGMTSLKPENSHQLENGVYVGIDYEKWHE
jgi:glycosyltransferase involved in cell wall biosynthesis